jgi:hypothetical protein
MSTAVSTLINQVGRSECRGEGRPSRIKREFKLDEFKHLLTVNSCLEELIQGESQLESSGDVDEIQWTAESAEDRVTIHAFWCLQWHLITRDDCLHQLTFDKIGRHRNFDFAMKIFIVKSKNFDGRNHTPYEQIILQSADPLLCPIFNFARYLAFLLEGKDEIPQAELQRAMEVVQVNGERKIRVWFKGARTNAHVFDPLVRTATSTRLLEVASSSQFYTTSEIRLGSTAATIDYSCNTTTLDLDTFQMVLNGSNYLTNQTLYCTYDDSAGYAWSLDVNDRTKVPPACTCKFPC